MGFFDEKIADQRSENDELQMSDRFSRQGHAKLSWNEVQHDGHNEDESRPDKRTQELYIRDTGVHASTIWHDRYVSQMHPRAIAQDRDLPVDAVYEALAYCQEHWEVICHAKAQEQAWLQARQFFVEPI